MEGKYKKKRKQGSDAIDITMKQISIEPEDNKIDDLRDWKVLQLTDTYSKLKLTRKQQSPKNILQLDCLPVRHWDLVGAAS